MTDTIMEEKGQNRNGLCFFSSIQETGQEMWPARMVGFPSLDSIAFSMDASAGPSVEFLQQGGEI
jgi:hypothetical protein